MTARYLITVTDANAARLESLLGGGLLITSMPGGPNMGVPIAGLDAVTSDETRPVHDRLRTRGPLYHAGGPSRRWQVWSVSEDSGRSAPHGDPASPRQAMATARRLTRQARRHVKGLRYVAMPDGQTP
jgi:hypothetical protein